MKTSVSVRRAVDKYRAKNKDKVNRASREYHRKNYKANPLHYKHKALKRNYGPDAPAHFDRLLRLQKGKCAICSRKMGPPGLDHCAKTGKLRGLLCSPCNTSLGLLKESIATVKALLSYIRRYNLD